VRRSLTVLRSGPDTDWHPPSAVGLGHTRAAMPMSFDDFFDELLAEAQAEGLAAVAELEALRLHYSLARQSIERRRKHRDPTKP